MTTRYYPSGPRAPALLPPIFYPMLVRPAEASRRAAATPVPVCAATPPAAGSCLPLPTLRSYFPAATGLHYVAVDGSRVTVPLVPGNPPFFLLFNFNPALEFVVSSEPGTFAAGGDQQSSANLLALGLSSGEDLQEGLNEDIGNMKMVGEEVKHLKVTMEKHLKVTMEQLQGLKEVRDDVQCLKVGMEKLKVELKGEMWKKAKEQIEEMDLLGVEVQEIKKNALDVKQQVKNAEKTKEIELEDVREMKRDLEEMKQLRRDVEEVQEKAQEVSHLWMEVEEIKAKERATGFEDAIKLRKEVEEIKTILKDITGVDVKLITEEEDAKEVIGEFNDMLDDYNDGYGESDDDMKEVSQESVKAVKIDGSDECKADLCLDIVTVKPRLVNKVKF